MFPRGVINHVLHINLVLLVFLISGTFQLSKPQSDCANYKPFESGTTVFIENFSAVKCMKLGGFGFKPDSDVILDECVFNPKDNVPKDQQFEIVYNSLNKTTMKHNSGRGDSSCLVLGNNHLRNTLCNTKNMDQMWTFKPVKDQPSQFLIEQFSSKKCLQPISRKYGSLIQLVSCNAYQTEQIWKLHAKQSQKQAKPLPVISCGGNMKIGSQT